jgi:hypothetical protein
MEQYQELVKAVPDINAEIKKQTGHGVDDFGNEPETSAGRKASKKSKEKKSNIEATSDEDSE